MAMTYPVYYVVLRKVATIYAKALKIWNQELCLCSYIKKNNKPM